MSAINILSRIAVIVALSGFVSALPWWRQGKPEQIETRTPVSVAEAQRRCPITLPPDAKNVYFAIASDVTSYECFIRFEISYERGLIYAQDIFKEHAAKMKWQFAAPNQTEIIKPPQLNLLEDKRLHIEWFDIAGIKEGVILGEFASWQPRVWLDKRRNLLFYCLTD